MFYHAFLSHSIHLFNPFSTCLVDMRNSFSIESATDVSKLESDPGGRADDIICLLIALARDELIHIDRFFWSRGKVLACFQTLSLILSECELLSKTRSPLP